MTDADLDARSMVIERTIPLPLARIWDTWLDPDSLPLWWGPEGFSCRTRRIDLREGGEWVFDMIGPDGIVYPNHHRYGRILPGQRIEYTLLWGEDGPKHADAWVRFDEQDGQTRLMLCMVFITAEECAQAKGFGAEALGQQTLAKLERRAQAGG